MSLTFKNVILVYLAGTRPEAPLCNLTLAGTTACCVFQAAKRELCTLFAGQSNLFGPLKKERKSYPPVSEVRRGVY